MVSEKEIEAAIKAIETVPIMDDTYSLSCEDAKAVARAALEAAACVRAEANTGEPVAWGEDIDGKIVSVRLDKSRHCTVPLYRAPQPSRAPTSLADAEKAFLDRVWPRLQNGCYRAHGSIPVEIQGLNFNEFVRDGLCAVLEAAVRVRAEANREQAVPSEDMICAAQAQISEGIGAYLRKFADSIEAKRARDYLHKMPESEWAGMTRLLAEESVRAALRAALQEQGR